VPEAASPFIVTIILFVIVMICKVLLDAYLQTRSGYLLRAVGDNDVLVTSLAKDKGLVKIVGLAIANGFAALAGSVYCQQKGFFEISIGTGTMVIGLANVIIGTQLLKRVGFIRSTTAVIIGSIVYKACVSIALLLNDLHIAGLDLSIPVTASDLKLITSVLFLIILVVSPSGGKKVKSHA
jgi:putative ABC transport system permease protein